MKNPSERRAQWVLFALVFLDMAGFTMLIPDVQFRAEALGAHGWQVGAIMSSMFLAQTIFSPIWSSASDRLGRKRIMLLCTAFSVAAMFLYAFATALWLVLLCRILAGMGAANVAVGNALLTNMVSDEDRDQAISRFSAAMTAGLLLGPALGGTLAHSMGNMALGITAGVLSLLGLVAGFLFLPTDVPQADRAKSGRRFGIKILRDFPQLRVLCLVAMVAWFALALLEGTFGLLIQSTLGLSQREFGWVFSYESLIALGCQSWLLIQLQKIMKPRPLLILCLVFQGVGLALTPYAPNLAIIFVASTFFALGNAMSTPIVNIAASNIVPKERHGELFGLFQGWRGFGFLVAPAIGTQLFAVNHSYPYLMAGMVCGLGAVALLLGFAENAGIPAKNS